MQNMADYINFLFPTAAFIIGSIPFGLLFARMKGKDPRKYGSGNIGATNIARVLGKKWGLVTLFADILKGLVPVLLAEAAGLDTFYLALTGLGAVVGHCYSVFLIFHGGKGVATAAGVFLALCPKAVAVAAVVFFIVFRLYGYVSAASLSAAASIPVLMHVFCSNDILESMSWTICLVIWLKHSDNLKRLSRGEEKKISFK